MEEQPVSTDRQAEAPAPANDGAAVTAESADKLVVAFGDSLYAGYGLEPADGFVPNLQAALRDQGIDAFVHNAGVSGDTSAAGLRRMEFVLDSLPRKPDLVVLGLGGNDLIRGLDVKETRLNMTAMMDLLAKRDIPVVLTGMIAPDNLGKDYVTDFKGIYSDLAKEHDAKLYPFFLDGVITDKTLMLEDGIHPNAKGVDKVVARVAPLVAGALDG